jgi:hypothetical protein
MVPFVIVVPPLPPTVTLMSQDSRQLPAAVWEQVIADLSRRSQIAPQQLQLESFESRTWRNGCLELAREGEMCTQVLVPGWLVRVKAGKNSWTYHSNSNGSILRLASGS